MHHARQGGSIAPNTCTKRHGLYREDTPPAATANPTRGDERTRVLYIVSDDARPEMPSYGQDYVKAPNLAALSARGLTFMNAYCQQALPALANFFHERQAPAEHTDMELH